VEKQIAFDKIFNDKEYFVQNAIPYSARYAKTPLNPLVMQSYISYTSTQYSNDDIKKLLKDPLQNYKQLQRVSEYLESTNAFYTNIVYYYATILTYDYMITPINDYKIGNDTLKSRFLEAAKIAKKTQIQSNFAHMMYRTLLNGETYWYDLSDDNNTIFKEIPSKFCRRALVDEDNLWRYYIDFKQIDQHEIREMPTEIRMAYKNYVESNDKKSTKKIRDLDIEIPKHLYLVSKKGFSISSRLTFEQHDYPFFANMFVDLNSYDSDKEYFSNFLKSDNIKLVHFKVPIDKNTGKPIMDYDKVQKYHDAANSNTSDAVAVITNPFDVEGIATDKASQNAINVSENARGNASFSSGVSETMWNATTTNGLKFSVQADASKVKHIMSFFDNLMNYKLKETKMAFSIDREITWYNKEDVYKTRKEALGMGDLYSGWISAGAYEPYDAIKIAEMEDALNFRDLFRPKLSAFQQSGDSGEVGQGAPEKDDKADVTDENQQYK
jgi:hypothetical protein